MLRIYSFVFWKSETSDLFGANVICFTMCRLWIQFSYSYSDRLQRKPLFSDPGMMLTRGGGHSRRMRNPQYYVSDKKLKGNYDQILL